MLFWFSSKSFLFPVVVPELRLVLQLNFSLPLRKVVFSKCKQTHYFLELKILTGQDNPVLVLHTM